MLGPVAEGISLRPRFTQRLDRLLPPIAVGIQLGHHRVIRRFDFLLALSAATSQSSPANCQRSENRGEDDPSHISSHG